MTAKALLINLFFILSTVPAFPQIFQETEPDYLSPGFVLDPQSGTNGIAVADYDLDGDLDFYFVVRDSAWGGDQRTWNRMFLNQGMVLSDVTLSTGLKGLSSTRWSEMGYNIGASWGDINNDGYSDIFLYYTGKDQLFLNNGDGTFSDISAIAGIRGSETQLSSHGLWWDYDKDGDLDLYVTVRKDVALQDKNSKNRMYENIGDGKFIDVSEASGLDDQRLSYMSVAFDIDQDKDLDLYVANDFGPNSLYLNNNDKTFTRDSTNSYGIANEGESMGIALGDVNNDALLDIYVTNVTNNGLDTVQTNPLYLGALTPPFENIARKSGTAYAGWGWGTEFFDFDNDSDDDLFVSNGYFANDTRNQLFENASQKEEEIHMNNISDSAGIADLGVSRSNVVLDYNDDGFQDILVSNFYTKPKLYLNTNTTGNWFYVSLEGRETNFNGLGSMVTAEIGETRITRYVHGAQFFGQNILPLHFGLGNSEKIDKLTVNWLNGAVEEFLDLEANQRIKVIETEGIQIITSNEPVRPPISDGFKLSGNYPNPFNGSTQIQFELQKPGTLTLTVFDSIGRKVFTTSEYFSNSGRNNFSWKPGYIHSGIFLYRISRNGSSLATGLMHYLK